MTVSRHGASLLWERGDSDFLSKRYSRRHRVTFDGGLEVALSASPANVPLPHSDPAAMDPEEAFVAALASCHLLWFLAIAADRGFVVERYRDRPVGTLARDARGRLAMTEVVLHPEVDFADGAAPSSEQANAMHDAAHERCFIANSVTTEVRCEPIVQPPGAER